MPVSCRLSSTILALMIPVAVLGDTWIIQPGDTLSKIAQEQFPSNKQAQEDFIARIMENNPEDFPTQDPNRLTPGMELKLPEPLVRIDASIKELNGEVTVTHTNGVSQALTYESVLHKGDLIETLQRANVEIQFSDKSTITLKNNSQATIHEYNWNQEKRQGTTAIEFVRGAFRAISGLLGKEQPKEYHIYTPVSTIGVRGTVFGARVCGNNECIVDSEQGKQTLADGTYIGVLNGEIINSSGDETVNVKTGEAIYKMDAETPAKPADNIPGLIFSAEEFQQFAPAKETPGADYNAFVLDQWGVPLRDGFGACIHSVDFHLEHHVPECK